MTRAEGRPDVVVIGGGLAGITAAIELADAGRAVTLAEGRPWLGGATCSFMRRGLTIDNGQHVFLRCCTAYRGLLARLGVTACSTIQDRLDLTVLAAGTAPASVSQARLRRSALPSPAHLVRALAGYRLLSVTERARVAAAAVALQFTDVVGDDRSLADWLAEHGQHERIRAMLWDWLCLAAVNVPPERADVALAVSAIRTALLAGRDGADIGVPSVPLSRLHSAPAAALLGRLGVTIKLSTRVVAVQHSPAGGYRVTLVARAANADEPAEAAEHLRTAAIVLAVPPAEAAVLAPAGLAGEAARWSRLRPSPVVSVHVTYDRPVTRLPFAAVTGSPVRWVMDKTKVAGLQAGQYLAASLPAADSSVDLPAARLRELVLPLFGRLFPAAAEASVEDFFVTRERRATISQEPGVRRLRGGPMPGVPGLAVAGAWTDTGWPDSMEGAVRSGRCAALKVIADLAGSSRAAPLGGNAAVAAAAPSASRL